MTIFAALSYGELAGMFPKAGGQYVYLKEAYNPLTGFLYGWTSFLVIQTGTIAAVAMAFAKFAGVLAPWVSENIVWMQEGFFKFGPVQLVAIGSIAILTWVNTRGIQEGKKVQNFHSGKFILLILFIIIRLILPQFHCNTGKPANLLESRNSRPMVNTFRWRYGSRRNRYGNGGKPFSSDAWNNMPLREK
jgi:APA family basic amino acid/polyamine antiporter